MGKAKAKTSKKKTTGKKTRRKRRGAKPEPWYYRPLDLLDVEWRLWLVRIFGGLTVGAIALSLLGYLGTFNFLFDLAAHFKVQYCAVGCFCLIIFGLIKNYRWAMLSMLCILLNLTVILPWYLPVSQPVQDQPLRVFLANVNVNNPNYDQAIALITEEKPDLVAILETNRQWLQELQVIEPYLPFSLVSPRAEGFGIALYSRFPLKGVTIEPPVADKDYHLVANLSIQGRPITLVVMHPPPPKDPTLTEFRNRELQIIGNYVAGVGQSAIVVGDLNTTMWSPFYQRFARQARLRNSRLGFGILPTWPSMLPPLYIPIDHCLVSSDIEVTNTRTGSDIGSDHLPVITDLRL
ncbi:MAG: endonuclease/exonuclease/phosphatase family protein [Oculatellaceae cyanobacterium Prado106]|jgi:endonuclease/exonuclease/phosphatase (EEP) superfamily protein YafD|nr:endonuclease/exonuclease/phosphatase family protein [Oculatellaceae cyanobacterium Prado106]